MKLAHLSTSPRRELPGRTMVTLVSPELLDAEKLSACVITVGPGECVRPAHRHPEGEEAIYIMGGEGQALVRTAGGDEVQPLSPGTAVLFGPDDIHMIRNTGDTAMEVICFFAPPADPSTYTFYEDVRFPAP